MQLQIRFGTCFAPTTLKCWVQNRSQMKIVCTVAKGRGSIPYQVTRYKQRGGSITYQVLRTCSPTCSTISPKWAAEAWLVSMVGWFWLLAGLLPPLLSHQPHARTRTYTYTRKLLCVCSSNSRCTCTKATAIQRARVWYGMVWYGMVWYGMVWYCITCRPRCGSGQVASR